MVLSTNFFLQRLDDDFFKWEHSQVVFADKV